jgi:shikimate dehydrogenase
MNKIPLAGVIGTSVGHSRSPALHGTWLQQMGLRGHYVPLHVETADLADVLRNLPRAGFVGANVTIPHKEAVLALADHVTPTARRIGAANTLTFRDGGIEADNTDAYGFLTNLRDGAPGWVPGLPAVVLGAGGAARAVLVALADAGVPQIRLLNRTRARAETLRDTLDAPIRVMDWADMALAADGAGLVVNTTALGMAGNPPLELPLGMLRPGMVVTDIVYTPLDTPFLQAARGAGCESVDGLGMLLHQAVPGFERWFGARPMVTQALRDAVLAA